MSFFDLQIVSSVSSLFNGKVKKLTVTSQEGELGIYPNHSPIISLLKSGYAYFESENGSLEAFYISGGILKVSFNSVIILSNVVERSIDIDFNLIENAKKKLKENLSKYSAGTKDYLSVLEALDKIQAQEKISQLIQHKK